jgi:hypothetical protein
VAAVSYTIEPLAATPVFSLAAGPYVGTQTVTLSDATKGATVYYTTNGVVPTTASAKYSAAITVAASETIQAIAVATGYINSAVAEATYSISAPLPTFSPAAGTFSKAQTVTLSEGASGAVIYYTTNGATPTTASTKYTAPINVAGTETIRVIVVVPGCMNGTASAVYTIE